MVVAGVDLGTAAIKVVFVDEKKRLLWSKVAPTTFESAKLSKKLLMKGVEELSLLKERILGVATTGYGKRIFPDRERVVDEITAIGVGAYHLSNGTARTVVNIGGQDIKIVKLSSNGKIVDFKMNDKCAAGTGRFLEKAAHILDVSVTEFGDLGNISQAKITFNSTCAVFIESEIVSLLYAKVNKSDIITGLHQSIARRLSDLMRSLDVEEEIYLDGGPAQNKGLLSSLKEEFMRDIKILQYPQFTAAIGAAMVLLEERK
ncbi:MAG: CoA activase [Candidatus Omnitrophica bacterium]|nr:CoA activase [Candidatus Omnitrophota bacterium]